MPKSKSISIKPNVVAIMTVEISTTFTELIASSLVGQTTFLSSAYDSLAN